MEQRKRNFISINIIAFAAMIALGLGACKKEKQDEAPIEVEGTQWAVAGMSHKARGAAHPHSIEVSREKFDKQKQTLLKELTAAIGDKNAMQLMGTLGVFESMTFNFKDAESMSIGLTSPLGTPTTIDGKWQVSGDTIFLNNFNTITKSKEAEKAGDATLAALLISLDQILNSFLREGSDGMPIAMVNKTYLCTPRLNLTSVSQNATGKLPEKLRKKFHDDWCIYFAKQ